MIFSDDEDDSNNMMMIFDDDEYETSKPRAKQIMRIEYGSNMKMGDD